MSSLKECETDEVLIFKDDMVLNNRLASVYSRSIEFSEAPLSSCTYPPALVYKYLSSSAEDRKAFDTAVLEAIELREKLNRKAKASEKAVDYSKSFGGTEMDSKNEKEAAALLRGGKEVAEEQNPLLRQPMIECKYDYWLLRKSGKWGKFMGLGCYMYINTLTRDILSIKPDDYVEEEVKTAEAGAEAASATRDPSNGLPTVDIVDLPDEIDRIVNELKETPLIIDTSADQVVRTFFSYKGHLEDVSILTIPFAKSGVKQKDVVERCRKRLVGALKSGQTFALYLGSVTNEHADWKTKLCKKDSFPSETFREAGAALSSKKDKFKLIYKEDELEHGEAICRDGFRTIVITSLDPYSYEESLKDSLPLGYMKAIYVKQ
jgi:hypothetical protein